MLFNVQCDYLLYDWWLCSRKVGGELREGEGGEEGL